MMYGGQDHVHRKVINDVWWSRPCVQIINDGVNTEPFPAVTGVLVAPAIGLSNTSSSKLLC